MNDQLLQMMIQATSFISAFAGVAAGIIMYNVTKKFGTGILASGFKTISLGVVFIAMGIIMNVGQLFFDNTGSLLISSALHILEGVFFIIGTYIIVIGSKNTADKLETLTK